MINILFGIGFIIGGLSGSCVLRGTNSSGALIAVGIGLTIWGIIQVVRSANEKKTSETMELNLKAPSRDDRETEILTPDQTD